MSEKDEKREKQWWFEIGSSEQMREGRGERRHGDSMTKRCVSDVFGECSNYQRTFLASILRAVWVPALTAASLVCPPAP